MPKKQSEEDKNCIWTGSSGASVAGTWGAEYFIALENLIAGCKWNACLMTVYDINPLMTVVNKGLFCADRVFCARKSRLPEASA